MGKLQREQSQILLRHLTGRYKRKCFQFVVQQTLIEYKRRKCPPESDTALEWAERLWSFTPGHFQNSAGQGLEQPHPALKLALL